MTNNTLSGPVDVLATGPVTVSAKELEWLLTSPSALRVLADYNDYNETMADACGADASFNRARREWFNAEAARIEAEWEAERTPEQRVFVHNAAVAELIDAGNAWCDLMPGLAGGPEFDRLTAALTSVGGAK